MDISTVVFFLVVCGFHGMQAGHSGPTLGDRVAVMEEEMKFWKIATVQAKTERNTLARRMRLAFAEINILKSSLQNTKTQLKEVTQELWDVRRERDTYSESLRKLRGEVTEDIRALKLLLTQSVADLSDARMMKSDLNLTNGDLLATKQQIAGLTQDLMALNMSCCRMRKEAEETYDNESSPTTSSLTQAAFTTATTMHPRTAAASTDPNTVPPAPVTSQDLLVSTTYPSVNLTSSKTDPPAALTTQDCDPHATPSPATARDLYIASRDGDLERVRRILAACHVDINTRVGKYSRTPVMLAARNRHRDVVEFLLGRGADVSLVDRRSENALHYACWGGHLETVKLILSLDVLDINSRERYSRTPIMAAALKGHSDVVEFLVGRGADVSLVDRGGDNALHLACRGGDLETMKQILAADQVDINSRGEYRQTPVMVAAWNGHRDVVEFLVGRGADVSLVDVRRDNFLHLACRGGDLETVKLILSLDVVDINARNKKGWTAADYARLRGHHRVLYLLVSRGGH